MCVWESVCGCVWGGGGGGDAITTVSTLQLQNDGEANYCVWNDAFLWSATDASMDLDMGPNNVSCSVYMQFLDSL